MKFYWGEEVADIRWPDTPWGECLSKLLPPLCKQPEKFVSNVQSTLGCLQWEEDIVPITIADFPADVGFVTSPFTQYIEYGREELRLLPLALRKPCEVLVNGLAAVLKSLDFERTVMVNNWLLTTNFYNDWKADTPSRLLQALKQRFPDRAILFRSVNPVTEGPLLTSLTNLGFRRLLSRQIYLRPWEQPFNSQLKNDRRIFRKSAYSLVEEIADEDLERIQQLYQALYIEKYSHHNPHYTTEYIRLLRDSGFMNFYGFRSPEGRIDAFLAYMHKERHFGALMAQPLFGYDTSLPKELALYRLLSTQTILEGQENNRLVHLSAGVGQFKRNRGATAHLEFNCVYHSHLPLKRRLPWLLLEAILRGVATPILQAGGY